MENMEKLFLRVDELASAFHLPIDVAREIVTEQTRRALLRSVSAWMLFVLMLASASWFAVSHLPAACYLTVALGAIWFSTGHVLARSSILSAARHKESRLAAAAS